MTDAIPDNQSLINGSVKIYETSISKNGSINVGNDVTDQFMPDANENQVNIDFGKIDKIYRIEFKTKDKDGIYNSDEKYTNTAQFIPREGEVHNLTANVTLPNQGEFLGKTGTHNKEDWTIDWKIDVNKSLSTTSDFTVTDDLGDPAAQILLEDTIKVTKAGSTEELEEGEGKDYKLTVEGNKFKIYFPGEITEAYEITYSSYILTEEDIDLMNEAEIQSNDVIKGTTEKKEKVNIRISSGGGTSEETGGLKLEKFEADSERALKGVEFKLIKKIGNKEIVVREGTTGDNGVLEWKGLQFGDYTLTEVIPEGYTGEESQTVSISKDDPKGIKILPIKNERETGTARIIKVDSSTDELLENAEFTLINQTTNQEYTFKTDEDGVILEEIPFGEYTVKEITAPEGYRITKDIPNITVEIGKTATIEVENVAFVDITGQKTWFVDKDKELPEDITVVLLANGKNIAEQKITKDNNWKYSFKNLDKYNKADREINYEIKEIDVDGYITEQDGYDLTNIQTTNVSGIKTWIDDNNPDRPELITVQLLADGKKLENKTVEVTKATDWVYHFTDLPKYDTDGKKIKYEIEELAVDGYKSEIEDFDITNTRESLTSVKGEKTWKDEDPTDRPSEIKVDLTREVKGKLDKDFKETQTVKPNAKGKWLYDFDKLAEFDENGVAYTYIIKEDNVPANYESTVDEHDITNVRIGETEVSGTKRWKDDKVDDRPESIKVNLLRNNVVVDTIEEVTAEDDWKYSFKNLDKYDEDGKSYEYKVKEEQVPGYAPSITGNDITNTRSEKTSIEITKGWLDGDSENRPDSVSVYVYQNKKLFDTVNIKASNDWEYELTDLEAYDEDGQPYEYTIAEKAIKGYDSTVDGFNITNLRVGKRDIEVDKAWVGPKTKKVEVTLLADGETTGETLTLNEENEWKGNYEDLDKYNKEGELIDYTVVETEVENNDSEVTGSMEDGFTVTNTNNELTDIEVNKAWIGAKTEEVEIRLLADGKATGETLVLNEENEWKGSFKEIDKYNKVDGDLIEYTVEEVKIDGYDVSITGDAKDGYKVTNTEHMAKTSVDVSKEWVGTELDSVTISLMEGKRLVASTELNSDNDWKHTFSDLDKYDNVTDKNEIEYTVKEVSVDSYETSITGDAREGYKVTNTELIDIPVEKVWELYEKAKEEVTINLLADGDEVDTVKLNEENDWKHVFKDLPAADREGTIKYSVEEIEVEGFEVEVTGDTEEGFTVTNTEIVPQTPIIPGTTTVDVEKVWVGLAKEEVTINLLADGEKVDSVKLNKDNNWKHTFTDLPVVNDVTDETVISYTVEEAEIDGYDVEIRGDAKEGYTVTNTELIDIPVEKVWELYEKDKEEVTINLLANGDEVDSVKLNETNSWEHIFTDLPAANSEGTIKYSVEEIEVEGFEVEITGDTAEGFTVTNTEKPEDPDKEDQDGSDKDDPTDPSDSGTHEDLGDLEDGFKPTGTSAIGLGLFALAGIMGVGAVISKKKEED